MIGFKKILLVCSCLIAFGLFSCKNKQASVDGYPSNATWVDIRTPEEYAQGTIGEAININFYDENFTDKIKDLQKKHSTLVLFCRTGGRSAKAMKQLTDEGVQNIYEYPKGYVGYKEELKNSEK